MGPTPVDPEPHSMTTDAPRLIEPDTLQDRLGGGDLLVVDLSKPATYAQAHVPGAVHLDHSRIVAHRKPVMGLMPPAEELGRVLSELGLRPDLEVVAYDDEGGGWASRFLWTLDVLGHPPGRLLNGGIIAWYHEGHPVSSDHHAPQAADYTARYREDGPVADKDYILAHLDDPDVVLLDARSPEEYRGTKRFAARGGHIPGAVNYDWVRGMDPRQNYRMRPAQALRAELAELGVTPDKEVVVYCQTHHRSSYSYILLRQLGFPRVRGYPGSWSDWGNDPNTPVET